MHRQHGGADHGGKCAHGSILFVLHTGFLQFGTLNIASSVFYGIRRFPGENVPEIAEIRPLFSVSGCVSEKHRSYKDAAFRLFLLPKNIH